MGLENYFSLCDTVVWDRNRYPNLLGDILAHYGEGPFRIVGLRLRRNHPKSGHPVAVTIETANGRLVEFAGEWFKKI